jgi:hypothetical protein
MAPRWILCVLMSIAALPVSVMTQSDAQLDAPYSTPKYLIYLAREYTMNGPMSPDMYKLFDSPLNGRVTLSDSMGGPVPTDLQFVGGPYYTWREVCNGAPNDKAKRDMACPRPPAVYEPPPASSSSVAESTPVGESSPAGQPSSGGGLFAVLGELFTSLPLAVRTMIIGLVILLLYQISSKGGTSGPRNQTQEKVLASAEHILANNRSDYLFNWQSFTDIRFNPGENKCNLMVANAITGANLPSPLVMVGADGQLRYPSANEWADPQTRIVGYHDFGGEAGYWEAFEDHPRPGDVIAIAAKDSNRSGHVGIVDRSGCQTISASARTDPRGTVVANDWGFNEEANSEGRRPVYRRWVPYHGPQPETWLDQSGPERPSWRGGPG